MMRWVGLGLIAAAIVTLLIVRSAVRSDAEERRVALAQASYRQGTCTITGAEAIDWRHDTKDETIRGTTIEVTMIVHAPVASSRACSWPLACYCCW